MIWNTKYWHFSNKMSIVFCPNFILCCSINISLSCVRISLKSLYSLFSSPLSVCIYSISLCCVGINIYFMPVLCCCISISLCSEGSCGTLDIKLCLEGESVINVTYNINIYITIMYVYNRMVWLHN